MTQRIVDLSVPVGPDTLGPPSTNVRLELEEFHRGPGFWQVSSVRQSLHTGTHVDTPLHCFEGGSTTSDVELDALCGAVAFFDVEKAACEPVREEDLAHANPGLKPDQVAVIRTGWSDRAWGEFPRFYVDSPFLEPAAAEWLAGHRPRAVVFDFFEEHAARKLDFTSEEFVVHRILLGGGIHLVEQATNLLALHGRAAQIFPAFYKIQGVEGAPARVFALVEEVAR